LDGDITDATQRAVDDAVEFRATDFIYDNVGNGASVKTYASMGGKPAGLEFHGFGAGESPDFPNEPFEEVEKTLLEPRTNADVFKNKRAQYWWYLRERFFRTWQAVEKKVYHDPATLISISSSIKELPNLKSEIVKVPRKRTAGSRLIQIVSKDELQANGIPSPNLADSLMKSFAIAPKSNFVFERRPVQRRR
jgi:phage terminase large subunit